jgi:hypothetical protein
VVCVLKYEDEAEAVAMANDSIYGLGGGLFSSNMARAQRIAGEVRTGTMWINAYHAFGDFAPFGGYKQSGFGRENGDEGLKAYTQVKRVHVGAYADKDTSFMLWRFTKDGSRCRQYPALPLSHQRHLRQGVPTGHQQGDDSARLLPGPRPHRRGSPEGRTRPARPGSPRRFLRGLLRPDRAGHGPRHRGRCRGTGPLPERGLHRQRGRRERQRHRQGGEA